MSPFEKKQVLYVATLFFCVTLAFSVWAGISYTDYLAHTTLKNQIRACPIVIDVKTLSIKTTKQTRNSGYLKYDDYGPYIKTKEQKVLVRCIILNVQKNISKLKLMKDKTISLTFWKQITGPISRNHRNSWQKPPTKKVTMKVLFIRGAYRNNYFLPTIIHTK